MGKYLGSSIVFVLAIYCRDEICLSRIYSLKILKHRNITFGGYMKNVKYFCLLVAMYVAIGVFSYAILFALGKVIDTSGFLVFVFMLRFILTAGITIYFVFRKWQKKCNIFIVPANFLILPFLLYGLIGTGVVERITGTYYDWEGWAIMFFIDVFIYSLPLFILTLILAIVIKIKTRKQADSPTF